MTKKSLLKKDVLLRGPVDCPICEYRWESGYIASKEPLCCPDCGSLIKNRENIKKEEKS